MSESNNSTFQLTTFKIGGELYGIEVLRVQEVTGQLVIVPVPLAPVFVRGLINLRGQIATALGLQELFTGNLSAAADQMSVVCKIEGNLVSLLVDSIGDVIEVDRINCERAPDHMPLGYRKYIKSICKLNNGLLSIIDLDVITKELSPNAEAA